MNTRHLRPDVVLANAGRQTCGVCGRTVAPYRGTYRHAKPRRFTAEELAARTRARDLAYRVPRRAQRAAAQRTYRAAHLDERRAYDAAYNAAHREQIKAQQAEYRAKLRAEHPERLRARRSRERLKQHGLTSTQHAQMLDAQGGGCAICGQTDGLLHIDHDHRTGRVRGLLCGRCNRALGMFNDSSAGLRVALEYLEHGA